MNRTKKSGFSLIELMVVVSIIGVLMAVGAVSYTTAQRKGRDATRKSDIKGAQQALEQFYTVYAAYKTTGSGTDTCTDLYSTATFAPGGKPTDPRNIAPNVYTFSCNANTYCVCARLENELGNSPDANCNYTASGDKDYFCVTNQQ